MLTAYIWYLGKEGRFEVETHECVEEVTNRNDVIAIKGESFVWWYLLHQVIRLSMVRTV